MADDYDPHNEVISWPKSSAPSARRKAAEDERAAALMARRPVVGACQFDTLLREHVVILPTPQDWPPDAVAVRIVGRGPDSFWQTSLQHLDGINYELPEEGTP